MVDIVKCCDLFAHLASNIMTGALVKLPMKNWNKATDILKDHQRKEYHITASLRYGSPNGAKFRNSNLITFKDNDHIRIQDMKINQIQQASRSYSRSYITFNMNIPDIHIQHIEN